MITHSVSLNKEFDPFIFIKPDYEAKWCEIDL